MLKTIKALEFAKLIILRRAVPAFDFVNYTSKATAQHAEPTKDLRITLINTDENVTILNLSEAQNMSKAQSLKLVKITDLDVKTRRPLYRLISPEDYIKARLKARLDKKEAKKEWSIKGEKDITISAKIGEGDLITSSNKIKKWLDKCYSVRVIINGEGNIQNADAVMVKILKSNGENTKVQQKSIKGATLKFNLLPLPPNSSTDHSENEIIVEKAS